MKPLSISSCQAPNSEPIMRSIIAHLQRRLGIPMRYVDECEWQERYARLDAGTLDAAWICGAPYVRRMAINTPVIDLLAAPVWRAPRYQNRPVYFSEIIVRADSPLHSFADLRGAGFAYNEPESLSGCEVMRHHLATIGAMRGYFGRVVASGAHLNSLQMILAGQIDAAAIDSTVLESEIEQHPDLAHQLRCVDVLGPNMMPPWVAGRHLPASLRADLRAALTTMHQQPDGVAVLATTPVARFASVTEQDYNPLREMLQLAEQVIL